MRNRKKLVKNVISIIVTLGITTISSSATDARPLKGNIEKAANSVSRCIRNHKQKPTPPKVNLIPNTGNKGTDDTSSCWVCRVNKKTGYCSYRLVSCVNAYSTCSCE